MKYTFGDIVIVEGDLLGVIVKSWVGFKGGEKILKHEIYVRNFNSIKEYPESDVRRYMVRHKELSDEEKMYQFNTENDC